MVTGTGRHGRGPKAEINVTPLVDVVFVLLIVFMVVTPLITGGKAVALPAAKVEGREEKADAAALVVSLSAERQLWVGQELVTKAEVQARVKARLKGEPDLSLLLKVDAALDVADVRPLLSLLKAAGATRVRLAVAEPAEG